MNLFVNGVVVANGREFWRVDDMDERRVGIDLIANPTMLVRNADTAQLVVMAVNAYVRRCPTHGHWLLPTSPDGCPACLEASSDD